MFYSVAVLVIFATVDVSCVKLDIIDCGIDHELTVSEGDVPLDKYAWLGIFYYTYYGDIGETRAVTTVILIQKEFVIASAADIGPIPKVNFRANSMVVLGLKWDEEGHRVRNYVMHPEYGETHNTVALIQLKNAVNIKIRPVCPPPERLRNPEFYVMKFKDDYTELQKQVIPVAHVPSGLCKEFYVRANLYAKKMRPPHVACAVSVEEEQPCVWNAGSALVARDVWGRWQFLGLGVRGPGCGAPSRYLDMMSYYPWIELSLEKFQRITISKLSNQKYVLRSGSDSIQKFGSCDPEEMNNIVYREVIMLVTDNNQFQFLTYNMSIYQNIEYSCLTLEITNASAVSEMRVRHRCTRYSRGPPCYTYHGTVFDITVFIMFSDKCIFEMNAWGWKKDMKLLDVQEWKWEEGTYYEDFNMQRIEYRGPVDQTSFGFEPLDVKMWVPEYDIWTTTEFDNSTWSSTTPPPKKEAESHDSVTYYEYWPTKPTTTKPPPTTTTRPTTTTTSRTKRTFKRKTTTTTTTSTTEPSTSTVPAG